MSLLDKSEAIRIKSFLINNPVAPGVYSHFINVGTNHIIDTLEENYFKTELPLGISCFKYLQGYYGSGKSQFINSLAASAWKNDIVTSIVNVGNECPFNSPLAIYQAVVSNFLPPPEHRQEPGTKKGIEILVKYYINKQIRQYGVEPGNSLPQTVRDLIEQPFRENFDGAPDSDMARGMRLLGKVMLNGACGSDRSPADEDLISWARGDKISNSSLKTLGLHSSANDNNSFKRLKTLIMFMTERMGVKGFFIAFDEGARTVSFRRGSIKQKQAIENMLTMINDGADGKFPGVMFLYAATPDFRNDVIQKYPALNDRIGDIAFRPGSPMVPFIDLDILDTRSIVREIGKKLLEVFSVATGVQWDSSLQKANIECLLNAEDKRYGMGAEIRRSFVYHFCLFLGLQIKGQFELTDEDAEAFIVDHQLPGSDNEDE